MSNEEIKTKVPYKMLMKMHQHYQNHICKHLTSHYKREETSSIWFDKNEIKQFFQDFLDDIDNESGLRLYLCEYEADTLPATAPSRDIDRLTIGLVATRYNPATDKHEDIHDSFNILGADPNNHGKICPPDY